MTDQDCHSRSPEVKKIISQISFELQEFLKLVQNNASIETLMKFSETLKELECGKLLSVEDSSVSNIINDCISILSPQVTQSHLSEESKYFYFELFVIISLLKLKFIEHDIIDYTDTSENVINYGLKVLRYCIDQELYSKAKYYVDKCEKTIELILLKYKTSDNIPLIKLVNNKKITLELFHVETMLNSENLEDCLKEIKKVKLKLPDFSSQYGYFVRICYNTSLKLATKEHFDKAITVLEATEDCLNCNYISGEDVVLIHSLLAAIYLQNGPELHWEQCLKHLNAAYKIDPKPVFLMNMLRVSFYANDAFILNNVIDQMKSSDYLTVEVSLSAIDELRQNGHEEAAMRFCHELRTKTTSNDEKIHYIREEMDMCFKRNRFESVCALLEDIIVISKRHKFDPNEIQRFCKIVAQNATHLFKEKRFSQCLTWYKKCCQLIQQSNSLDPIFQYFQQRICFCYVEMDESQMAKRTFSNLDWETMGNDPLNVYLALRVAVMCEDECLAEKALQHIGEEDERLERAVLACCKTAFTVGKKTFLCTILEGILERSNSGNLTVKAAQCLVRLHLNPSGNEETSEKILSYLDKALESMKQNTEKELAEWFSRISWNLGLQAESTDHVSRFLLLSCLFLDQAQCPQAPNALVLTAAAGMHLLRSSKDQMEIENIGRKVLHLLDKSGAERNGLLRLYELECRLRLRDPNAEMIFRQMLSCADARMLENAASVIYGVSSTHYKLVVQALKGAIGKVTERFPSDAVHISKLYRHLTQVLFFAQDYLTATVAEDAIAVCENILEMLNNEAFQQKYPQIEVLRLMIQCWNRGVRRLSVGEHGIARRWCVLAQGFLQKLDPLKELYEKKLSLQFAAYFQTDS